MFVGPSPEVLARMGDKASARDEMRAAGVPLAWGTPPVEAAEVLDAAEGLGLPVLLKATGGGGGKGMRLVEAPDQLERAFTTATAEAEAAFGDGRLYLEKAIVPRATSRSRCWETRTAAFSPSASASARSSAAIRN